MADRAHLRLTGLLLALCLNAAFIAMFVWQARPGMNQIPEPSRMALVWAVPLVEPPAPLQAPRPSRARAQSGSETNSVVPARRPAPAITAPPAAPDAEAVVESGADDPFEQAPSALAESFDKAVVGKAIKTAMAERQALEDTQKFVKSGRGKTKYEKFADNAEFATIPYCLGSDPMKHTPPVVEIGKVKVGMGGLLALPFFAKAVATGKCRIK